MEVSKYPAVAGALVRSGARSVLDVGCRDRVLERALSAAGAELQYTGLDMVQHPSGLIDIVADLSQGIPLVDRSVEAVVALDVLEHVDDLQAGLVELCRVAEREVLVVLPNMGHLRHRLRFALKADLGGKYELTYDQGPDRHRWLTVLRDTDTFMSAFASKHGWTLEKTDLSEGVRRHRVHMVMRAVRLPRSLFVWSCLYRLTREPASADSAIA